MVERKLSKMAFYGPAAVGKTWCAQYISAAYEYQPVAFAAKLKLIAKDLFNVQGKNGTDREVLQQLGGKMRAIRPSVWIDYLLASVATEENTDLILRQHLQDSPECTLPHSQRAIKGFVLDDLRYENEATALRAAGWTLVMVTVPEAVREWRLSTLYPDTPLSAYYHASEQEWQRITPDFSVESVSRNETEMELDNIVGLIKNREEKMGSLQNV